MQSIWVLLYSEEDILGFLVRSQLWGCGQQSTWTFFSKWRQLHHPHFMAGREVSYQFFADIMFLLLIIKLFLQYKSLNYNLERFQKCTVILTLWKHNFYLLSSVVDSRTYYRPFLTNFHTSGSRGLSEAEQIWLRIDAGESDLELSGDEVEEGQAVEMEGESSEEDISALEETEQGERDNTDRPLWIRSNV